MLLKVNVAKERKIVLKIWSKDQILLSYLHATSHGTPQTDELSTAEFSGGHRTTGSNSKATHVRKERLGSCLHAASLAYC